MPAARKAVAAIAVKVETLSSASFSPWRQSIRWAAVGVIRRMIAIAAHRSAE